MQVPSYYVAPTSAHYMFDDICQFKNKYSEWPLDDSKSNSQKLLYNIYVYPMTKYFFSGWLFYLPYYLSQNLTSIFVAVFYLLDRSSVQFSSKAFSDPYRYLEEEELDGDIQKYNVYMTGNSNVDHGFKVCCLLSSLDSS